MVPTKEPKWKKLLEGYDSLGQHERPYLLQALYEHLYPLGKRLGDDWLDTMALGFFSSAFPMARFENLPLNLWTLGISAQGVGKSVVSDELSRLPTGLLRTRAHVCCVIVAGNLLQGLIRRLAGRIAKCWPTSPSGLGSPRVWQRTTAGICVKC